MTPPSARKRLGTITHGSLTEGLEMRLLPEVTVEELRAGKFVVVEGDTHRFFSMITDVTLTAEPPDILRSPPAKDQLLALVLHGEQTYATVSLRPMLIIDRSDAEQPDWSEEHLQPVKTIPVHFSEVTEADERDVAKIFGREEKDALRNKFFHMGTPLDMDTPVCINLERFIERSNGIFGKTGTGKSFFTRLVLAGLVLGYLFAKVFSPIRESGFFILLNHLKGLAVLVATVCLVWMLLTGAYADKQYASYVSLLLTCVVSFYFGSRS